MLPPPVGRHVQATVAALASRPSDEGFARVVEVLVTAWAEGRRARIWYPSGGQVRERLIEPYALEPSGLSHSLYAISRDARADAMRTFKVERIREIELTGESFEPPEGFDVAAHLGSSWSVWSEEPVEVAVRFSPVVAPVVLEAVWHPSQRTEQQADGALLWRARVSGTVEITPWLRSWGADAEVLEPLELRDRLAAESRRLAALYHPAPLPPPHDGAPAAT